MPDDKVRFCRHVLMVINYAKWRGRGWREGSVVAIALLVSIPFLHVARVASRPLKNEIVLYLETKVSRIELVRDALCLVMS